MLALILNKDGEPQRVFPTEELRAEFIAEFPLKAGDTLAEDAEHDTVPDGNAFAWNGTTFAAIVVTPPTPIASTLCTVLEFKGRFTQAERDLIEVATVEHPDRIVRARLRMIKEDAESAKDKIMDRADPRVQRGVGYLATVVFEGAPLIEAARVPAIIGGDAFNPANFA